MSVRRTSGLLALVGAFALAGCQTQSATPQEPTDLASLVVVDDNFTFATTKPVELRLEPASTRPEDAQLVQIRDAEGRRLFAGVVLQPTSLDLQLSTATADALTVVTGQGATAVTQTVSLSEGRGTVQF